MMQEPDGLSDEAQIAYRAFVDMTASKAAHFNCLQAIEAIYESGGVPGLAENLELEKLLASHDRNVVAFQAAMAAVTDGYELRKLIQFMS